MRLIYLLFLIPILMAPTCPSQMVFIGASTTQCGIGDDDAILPEECSLNWVGLTEDQIYPFVAGINAGCGGSIPENFTGEIPIQTCGLRVDSGVPEPELEFDIPPGETLYHYTIGQYLPINGAAIMLGVNTASWCSISSIYVDPAWADDEYCLNSYEQALRQLIAQLQADGVNTIILMTPPPTPTHYQNALVYLGEPTFKGFIAALVQRDIILRPQMPAIIQQIALDTPGVILGPNLVNLMDPVLHFDPDGCCDSHANKIGHQLISDEVMWVFTGNPARGWE